MNALSTITAAPLDDITTFLGVSPADDYEARVELRYFRNLASAMIAVTDSADAYRLAWMTVDAISPVLFCPGLNTADLVDMGRYAESLMTTAVQADLLREKGMLP